MKPDGYWCIIVNVDVDRFYGIEYEEFPAQIAQVAMWLIDHQMND
ncbi:MAG: DNA methyltransferase [Chitinophagaceae bacterium]